MPNTNSIKKTMVKLKLPQDVIAQMGFDGEGYNPVIAVMGKMNDMLTSEQLLAVMEQQGCHKGGKMDKASKVFGEAHADKSLAEKLEILSKEKDTPYLNDDGTLGIAVRCYVDDTSGVFPDCHCISGNYDKESKAFAAEHPDKILSLAQTFCGCFAGHWKHHLQNRLRIKLRLTSIGASPAKTEKGYPRMFTYEIVG